MITTGAHTIRDHITVLETWLYVFDPEALASVRQVVTPDTPADQCIDYVSRLEAAVGTLWPLREGRLGLNAIHQTPMFAITMNPCQRSAMVSLNSQHLSPTNQTEERSMNRFNELKAHVDALEEDFGKFFDRGNRAAGTRVRKGLQQIKALAQTIRNDIQEKKAGM